MPDPPQIKIGRVSRQNTQDPEYLERTGMAQLKRMVHAIELTWHRIEGESIDAKISWVMKNLYRELDLKLLYLEIRRVSGGGLMQLNRDDSNDKVMSISSPSDWAKLSRKETKFRIPHVGHELVFTLRGIPGVKLKEINQECIPPKPPDRPVRTPGTNKIAGIEPDLDNPEYRATCQRLSDQRSLLIIEEALGFTFPGATVADRLAWLGERPCDEVEEIRSFIEYVVASLETRADFFTV